MANGINPEGFIETGNLENGIELYQPTIEESQKDAPDAENPIDEALNQLDSKVDIRLMDFEKGQYADVSQLEANILTDVLNGDLDNVIGEAEEHNLDDFDYEEVEGSDLDALSAVVDAVDESAIDNLDLDNFGTDDDSDDDLELGAVDDYMN